MYQNLIQMEAFEVKNAVCHHHTCIFKIIRRLMLNILNIQQTEVMRFR